MSWVYVREDNAFVDYPRPNSGDGRTVQLTPEGDLDVHETVGSGSYERHTTDITITAEMLRTLGLVRIVPTPYYHDSKQCPEGYRGCQRCGPSK